MSKEIYNIIPNQISGCINNIEKSIGGGEPEGIIKEWKGKKYNKKDGKWVEVEEKDSK